MKEMSEIGFFLVKMPKSKLYGKYRNNAEITRSSVRKKVISDQIFY